MVSVEGDRSHELNTRQFTCTRWSLVADASDLGPAFRAQQWLTIRSHKTGVVVRCYRSRVERDREGEITGWEYKPASLCQVFRVLIAND